MKLRYTVSAILATASLGAAAERLQDHKAYYPAQFYSEVENGHAFDLKKNLFTILSSAHTPVAGGHDQLSSRCSAAGCYQHSILGYTPAREILFGNLHLQRYGAGYAIRDVYCQQLTVPADYKNDPPAPGNIPNPTVINVEHTWPQSKFSSRFPEEMQKSDLHALFPALPNANTSRSNHEFGEVVTVLSAPCPLASRGYTASGGRDVHFEPPEVHKGNAARAIFYFSIRYKLSVSADQEASLRAWHREDPPDDFERRRHEQIFAKQKVRNPFIDHPELVDLIQDF